MHYSLQTTLQTTMPELSLDGTGLHIGIIVARYNWQITGALLRLAFDELVHLGVESESIRVVSVPGSYELATVARAMINGDSYDALICLGCVMKGATRHDVVVGDAAAQGIQRVALDTNVPIILGVLCTENQAQAEERLARGPEFAQAAVEIARTIQLLRRDR